jgi:transcriptional regulator with XRE-family HTH domain
MSGEPKPLVEVEVRHYSAVLRQAIRAAGLSVTEVERRLGVGPKSLRRVFGGQVDLKFKHLVAVLRAIGMSHEEFFAIALRRRRRRRSQGGEFLAAFHDGYEGELVPIANGLDRLSKEEFDREVEQAVDRFLKRRAEEGKPLLPEEPPPDREEGNEAPAGGGGGPK